MLSLENFDQQKPSQNTNKNDLETLYLDALLGFILRNDSENSINHKKIKFDFLSPEDLQNVNSLKVKIFLDEIRSVYQDQHIKNFMEVLLYPISKNTVIDPVLLGSLLDNGFISIESEKILNDLRNSKQALRAFRKLIFAIENNSIETKNISTNLNYRDFKDQFLSYSTQSVNNRMTLLAYFLTNLMEHLLINDLNKIKQNKLKQLIKHMNVTDQ